MIYLYALNINYGEMLSKTMSVFSNFINMFIFNY